jgi:hypothetical protein
VSIRVGGSEAAAKKLLHPAFPLIWKSSFGAPLGAGWACRGPARRLSCLGFRRQVRAELLPHIANNVPSHLAGILRLHPGPGTRTLQAFRRPSAARYHLYGFRLRISMPRESRGLPLSKRGPQGQTFSTCTDTLPFPFRAS